MADEHHSERNDAHDPLDRLLRETIAGGHLAEFDDELQRQARELVADLPDEELVVMEPLVTYMNLNGVVTTYFSGGSLCGDGQILSRPHILFPHLYQLEEALRLFEILAQHCGDEDIVQAVYHPVSESVVARGERLLHGEEIGFVESGGRIVSFDNTWALEIDSVEYEQIWLKGLHAFERPIPVRRPVGDRAWRFSVYLPVRHAEVLVRTAGELLVRDQ